MEKNTCACNFVNMVTVLNSGHNLVTGEKNVSRALA